MKIPNELPEELIASLIRIEVILIQIHDNIAAMQPQSNGAPSEEDWIEKQEVLFKLNISERSLFTLRKEGKITIDKIRGKIYYLKEDVERRRNLNP